MTSPAGPLLDFLLAPLAEFLDDPATEDLAIQRPGEAWVRRHGAWRREAVPLDLDALQAIAVLSGSLRRQEVGSGAPLCATELPGGQRLQICLEPTVPTGTISLTLRKHEDAITPIAKVHSRYQIGEWNRWKRTRGGRNLDEALALYDAGDLEGFLDAAVRGRLNMLLCGRTGVGKTTFSKSILAAVDPSERLVTIEDSLELALTQENVVRLLYSKDELSGAAVGPEDLLQASLRLRPDRVILQEVRDTAAFTYMSAICSGHPGSVSTVHGASAEDAVRRLFILAKSSTSGAALDDRTLAELISAAVDVIVPLNEDAGRFCIGSAWFAADAARRGETAADLLRAA